MKNALLISITSIFIIMTCGISALAEDPVVSFTNARNAFDAGDYKEAASRFRAMLDKDIGNEALQVETHKYLGVCYIFLSEPQSAEEQFLQLLNIEPKFKLDPLVFPIDVVDFFTGVQRKHALRLEKIAAAKAKADEERKIAEEKQRQAEIERLRTTVYYEKTVYTHSRLVSLMPFGAGQFQNGQKRKGILFLSGELFFLTSSIVTYALHESLRDESLTPFYSTDTRQKYEQLETGYRVANRISIGALSLLALVGIVDAIYHFTPTTVEWNKVDEKDVPGKMKPKNKKPQAVLAPYFDGHGAGLGAVGFF